MLRDILAWLWSEPPSGDGAVDRQARLLLLDTLGCAIAGAGEPDVRALAACLMRGAPGTVILPGIGIGLSQEAFAVVFAAGSCWHEACEGLAAAHGRPGLHAIPAVLGRACSQSLRGLLDAIVTGYEIGGRLGIAYRIKPGMHVDGTWGSFGAAAAASRQARLSADQALAALDHVACHLPLSLYRPVAAGSTARNAYVGHGAWLGQVGAAAAAAGMGGPPGSIADNYRHAVGADLPAIEPGPGRWLILEGYLKSYAAVKHVHYGALAASRWHAQGLAPASIERIVLSVYQEAHTYCGNRAPKTAIQAQFSLTYGLAWTLIHGDLTPAAYAAASLADPLVTRLEALIELQVRPGAQRACTLTVTVTGHGWTTSVETVPGDPANPLSPNAVAAKFRAYATPVIGASHADRLVARVLHGDLGTPLTLD